MFFARLFGPLCIQVPGKHSGSFAVIALRRKRRIQEHSCRVNILYIIIYRTPVAGFDTWESGGRQVNILITIDANYIRLFWVKLHYLFAGNPDERDVTFYR